MGILVHNVLRHSDGLEVRFLHSKCSGCFIPDERTLSTYVTGSWPEPRANPDMRIVRKL
jgi:hypothetical protein